MKNFFSKYIEIILIVLTIGLTWWKPHLPEYGERISMIMFATLAFYYLASGFLVFLDKYRVGRIMRLLYMSGLWSVSITVIAVMARTLLLQMDEELLILCISSTSGILLFAWIIYRRLEKEEERKKYVYQLTPLLVRSIVALMTAITFYSLSAYTVYYTFGSHRNDAVFTEKAVNTYEHPGDSLIRKDFLDYQEKFLQSVHDTTHINQ